MSINVVGVSIMKNQSPSDWRNSDSLDDDDFDTFDLPPLMPSFFENDKARQPQPKITVALQVDSDVLTWFRAQGAGWEKRMVAALRLYAQAHKDDPQAGS